MNFYDQDGDESVIDPWGEDGDELDVSMCDCCPPQASGIMTGLGWGIAFMVWLFGTALFAAYDQFVAAAVSIIVGLVVFIWRLYS